MINQIHAAIISIAIIIPLSSLAVWNSAQSIKREDLGHLSEGAEADIAVIRIRKGDFGFVDAGGYRLDGDQKLEAEVTLRAGKVVWDLNGLTAKQMD